MTYSLRVALHLVVTATILALTYLFLAGGQPYGSYSLVDLSSHLRSDLALPDLATSIKTQRINQALLHRRKGK